MIYVINIIRFIITYIIVINLFGYTNVDTIFYKPSQT
jgi:hypothetical protein